jgi:hypothetical protein
LLALVLPSMLVVPGVLGNLSLGLLPVFLAWAVSGLRLWREGPTGAAERSGTGGLRVGERCFPPFFQ